MMARWELRALALGLGSLMGLTACEGKAPQGPDAVTTAPAPLEQAPEVVEAELAIPGALELPEVEREQIKADAQATAKAEINDDNAAQVLDQLEAEILADADK